jgi:hypothetical protein
MEFQSVAGAVRDCNYGWLFVFTTSSYQESKTAPIVGVDNVLALKDDFRTLDRAEIYQSDQEVFASETTILLK